MLLCEIIEDKKCGVTVYGFVFTDSESGERIYTVRDVMTDKSKAHSLCETVNNSDLCREHIRDIIEDAI